MKKNLLTLMLTFVAIIGLAQASTWPITLTTADGLPGKLELSTYVYKSPLYTFDEAITTLRLTVCHTNSSYPSPEGYNGRASWAPGWAFWALSEFRIFDENGEEVTYIPTSNACAPGDGSLEGLYDKNITTHFHTTYGRGPMDKDYPYVDFQIERDDLTSFRFEWDTRNGYHHNQPTYIGLTPGTAYWPMPEQNIQIEKITSPEALKEEGGLFILEGHSADWEDPDRERVNIGGGFFEAPCLATDQPSAFGVFYLLPVAYEEDTYKVRYLNHDHYIRKTGTGGFGFVDWTANANNAEAITFKANSEVDGDFTLTTHHDSVVLAQDGNVRMIYTVNTDSAVQDAPRTAAANFSMYKVTIDGSTVAYQLQEVVDEAEARIAAYGAMEEYVDDQYDVLVEAVEEAKAILAGENISAADVISTATSLNAKIADYAAVNIFTWADSIEVIMDAINDGSILTSSGPDWINNSYPEDADVALQNAIDRSIIRFDTYRDLADIDAAIADLKATITGFWASKITNVKSLPLRIGQEKDGLPGVNSNSVWRWESPTIYLTEEVEELRFTVFKTRSGRNFNGYPFVCINEFELYSITGEKIELTEDCFETNSLKSSDGNSGGLPGLVDGNTANGYHFHSAWGSGNDTGYEGTEYVYLDITLPEPITGFKYVQYGRGNGYDDVPTDFVFGYYGETVDPLSVEFPDEYNAERGSQVKDITEITDNGIYAIYGMLNCDPVNGTGAEGGFYTSSSRFAGSFQSPCAFAIRKTGDDDDTYYIQSLADGKYWQSTRTNAPDYWTGGSATLYKSQAAKVKIEPNNNENLPYSFVIYEYVEEAERVIDGEVIPSPYVIAQDWGSGLGWFNVPSLDMNDKDGEGEWYIYHMSMDNPNLYWLSNLVDAAKTLRLEESADPGMYSDLGSYPETLAEAEAVIESNNENAAKAMVTKLQSALMGTETLVANPVSEGMYVIELNNPAFMQMQQKKKALYFMDPHTCNDFCGKYELGWRDTPEDLTNTSSIDPMYLIQLVRANENDEQVQSWLSDSLITENQVKDAYYIKSVKYNMYVGRPNPEESGYGTWYSQHIALSETPQPYMILQREGAAFDLWLPGGGEYNASEDGNLCFHAQDHGGGNGNAGHIVYWKRGDANSLWNLRKLNAITYNITLEGEGGTFTGAGEYEAHTKATITATPDNDHIFAGWYVDGVLLSNEANYTFTVEKSMTITAKFEVDNSKNNVSVDNLKCSPGSQLVIPVNMTNEMGITAFQLDFYLPDGMSIAVEDGEPMIELAAERKTKSHTITSSLLDNGATRIVSYSGENKAFAGNSGALFYVTVNVPDSLVCQDYTLKIKGINLIEASGKEYIIAEIGATITVASLLGDANMDDKVSIGDVVAAVNYILEKNPANFDFKAADINSDNKISIGDIVGIVNIILSGETENSTRAAKPAARISSSESITATNASGSGEATIPLSLNNNGEYTSFQMDVTLPEGTTFEGASLSDRATNSHAIAWRNISDSKVRIVAYSMANNSFTGNAGELLSLNIKSSEDINGIVSVENVIMANVDGYETAIGGCNSTIDINGTTGITGTDAAGLKIYTSDGALIVESSEETTLAVYYVDGRLVERLQIASGKNIFDTLEEGLYIIGGAKINIK